MSGPFVFIATNRLEERKPPALAGDDATSHLPAAGHRR